MNEKKLNEFVKDFETLTFLEQREFIKIVLHACCCSDKMPELIGELSLLSLVVAKVITENECNMIIDKASFYYEVVKNLKPGEVLDMIEFN